MKISATTEAVVTSIALLGILLITVEILWWIPENFWEVLMKDFFSKKTVSFFDFITDQKTKEATPAGSLVNIAVEVVKITSAALLLRTILKVNTFQIKSFEVAQVELLSRRLFTASGGTGLEVRLSVGSWNTDLIVFDPERMPIKARAEEIIVKVIDSAGNPVIFKVKSVGKVLEPLRVYNFGGLSEITKQTAELLGSALNAYMVGKVGYEIKDADDGRKIVKVNQDIFSEGRQKITDVFNGSSFFNVEQKQLAGGETDYYQYIVDGEIIYEYQEILIADAQISEAIARALEKLQEEGIDASGELGKGRIAAEIARGLKAAMPLADDNVIAANVAAAMGNDGAQVVYTTADTLVTGGSGASVLVGKK